ncbi:MAG: SusC/RagA family TonB-linked outer membrane protein [Gemmatimonadota bacterium]
MSQMPDPRASRRTRGSFIAACCIAAFALVCGVSAVSAQAEQTGTIVGVVSDSATTTGISNATIAVEQTGFGAIADQAGHYRVAGIPAGTYTLVARRIGYTARRQSVTVVAGQEVTADFSLHAATRSLDEIVITGTVAGEQSRSLGNVVSKISAPEVLERSQSPELGDLLKARAPGVTIAENTGRLGSGPNIQIRGLSSIGLNNTPLLYVDGVRVDNSSATGPVQTTGALGSQNAQVANRLNDINPQDIESIEIIKGPAAATIYGTEAANGVIQIITKKGGSNKPVFGLNVRGGSIFFRNPEGRLPTNYAPNGNGDITAWNGPQAEADSGRSLFTNGSTQMYNLSLSGGASQVKYFVSSTLQDDKGVESNNKARQYSAHANVNIAATPKLDVGTSLNYVKINNHLGTDGGVSSMLGAEIGHINVFTAARGFFPNEPPELATTLYDNTDEANRFTGSVTFAHRPTTWFSQRFIAGIDNTSDNGKALERFAPADLAIYLSPVAATGEIGQVLRQNTTITADYSGTATFKVSNSISSATSLGGQYYRTQLDTSYLGGQGFPAPGVEAISATATPFQSKQDRILNTTVGAYGQEQISWNDRLFLTAALRVDNNSAFGENFKWITYPKVSASWVVNEEPFWHSSFINTLHVRAAYGESGRAPAVFSALRTYIPIQGPLGSNAITAGAFGNANLQPERGKEVELGFDAQLFKRLELDFTYFNKHTTNEIVKQPLAPSTGFPGTQFANLGQVNNHGIELQATFAAITRQNWSWEITGNIATAKNKIISVGDLPSIAAIGQNNIVGYPIASYFAKHVISADRGADGFATNVMCDGGAGNGAVTCDVAPLLYSGSPTPTVTGAIGNTFNIGKRLRLYALVDFRHGNKLYNAIEEIRCAGEIGIGLCDANYHPEKYSTLYLAETDPGLATTGVNDQFIEDASFAKLREISATYALPERFIPGVRTASFTLAARELHTWTHYRGPDPEINYNANAGVAGINFDQGILPPLSRITASLNITF